MRYKGILIIGIGIVIGILIVSIPFLGPKPAHIQIIDYKLTQPAPGASEMLSG
jgi:hypothetical protein